MTTATLLLPERGRLAGSDWPLAVARALARADQSAHAPGEQAQLHRHFQLASAPWPVAALTRRLDTGEAGKACWLRADPAHVAPNMQGARLLAHGPMLSPVAADAAALLPALQPLFAESGYALDAPQPDRWYLRLPEAEVLPSFDPVDEVLGDDLFVHLPQGTEGRRWRALLTEVQVVLHQHPWNRERAARGQLPINSLWFWGGGSYPDAVTTAHAQVRSRDPLLRALALAAGVGRDGSEVDANPALIDLRHLRALAAFCDEAIAPLLAALQRAELTRLVLDFQDGAGFVLQSRQRWRVWRRPLPRLAP